MAKSKTPKQAAETPEELIENIKEIWKQHNKRRKQDGMV
jgi:predicted RNase H-like HicB family nuclease